MKVDGKRSQNQIKNDDILLSYIGLLCHGKTFYEDIREMSDDPDFSANAEMFNTYNIKPTPLETGMVPVDLDVTPMNNLKIRKEGVSYTYKGLLYG